MERKIKLDYIAPVLCALLTSYLTYILELSKRVSRRPKAKLAERSKYSTIFMVKVKLFLLFSSS